MSKLNKDNGNTNFEAQDYVGKDLEDKKSSRKAKIVTAIVVVLLMTTLLSFAASDVQPKLIEENGIEKVYFQIEHSLTNAQYKYYGYGYTVSVYDNDGKLIGQKFMENSEFMPTMSGSIETVKIPVEKLYDKMDINDEYYYRQGMTIWLDSRIGIKLNGKLTHVYDSAEGVPSGGLQSFDYGNVNLDGQNVPLNKDDYGIVNGINHEYGTDWSILTQGTLKQLFGIKFTLKPIFKYDGYKVEYKETGTIRNVTGSKELTTLGTNGSITEYPEIANGYKYSGKYEIKKTDSNGTTSTFKSMTTGDSASLNLQQTASIYTIIFYYDKVDLSNKTPIDIEVEYRKDTIDGDEVASSTVVESAELERVVINSKKSDGYKVKGYRVIGKETKDGIGNSVDFVIGKEGYSTPVSGKLKVIFIYEIDESSIVDKEDPSVNVESSTVNIEMKRTIFDSLTEVNVENAKFEVTDYSGKNPFKFFDLYIGTYASYYDIPSKSTTASLTLPKSVFVQSGTDPNLYTASIKTTYAVFDTSADGKPDLEGDYGIAFENDNLIVNITVVENMPPKAEFYYYTEKELLDGSKDTITQSYINRETILYNLANDPNGYNDILKIKYTFKDSNDNEYYVSAEHIGNRTYVLDSHDIQADNIEFLGLDYDGNVRIKFKKDEVWVVSQYVEDIDGLNNTYTENIHPTELDLRPKAMISENVEYQFPYGNAFNGKQNRVIQLNSNKSEIAEYLEDTGVSLDHSRDTWEITPLDGQSTDSIKFENEYSTITEDGKVTVKYVHLNNIKMMFKEAGRYSFRLQVSDTDGNVSNWYEQIITINEDKLPNVSADLSNKYYRDSSKTAKIIFFISQISDDKDVTKVNGVKYRYDSNNNKSFTDETIQTTNMAVRDVRIDGLDYKEVTFNTSNIGRYEILIDATETFGQETILKHIISSDYKSVNISKVFEVDNVKPTASLGTQKKNKIDVKIVTTGLSGTRNQDVQNSINNLKVSLENEGNIEVGDIEVVDLAKRVNGMTVENMPTWRRVILQGVSGDYGFWYVDNEPDFVPTPETPAIGNWFKPLPEGIKATGWNDIKLPYKQVANVWGTAYLPTYKAVDNQWVNSRGEWENFVALQSNYYQIGYSTNYLGIGNLSNSFVWNGGLDDPLGISAISEESIKNFDVEFTFSDFVKRYSGMGGPASDPDIWRGYRMFVFNVKDKNNYYAIVNQRFDYSYDTDGYERSRERGSMMPESLSGQLIKVSGGNSYKYSKKLANFYRSEEVGRVQQVGTTLKIYDRDGSLLLTTEIPKEDVGGYIGLAGESNAELNYLKMNFTRLEYIEHSSLGDAVNSFEWGTDTDKYVINLVENTSQAELTDSFELSKTVGKLQEKEINLINIGVNSVNKVGLDSMLSKNLNRGTYFELGTVANNLSQSSTYIKGKYNTTPLFGDEYIVLGDETNYIENYSDTESDNKMLSEYKYVHDSTIFENSLGTIADNNKWIKDPITDFNKVGKYTLSYRAKDNPLEPNKEDVNPFNNYRKYSNEFNKNIYVHRKPIANFYIDNSFKASYLSYSEFSKGSLWTDVLPNVSTTTEEADDYDMEHGYYLPDDAFNIRVTISYEGRYDQKITLKTDAYREEYKLTVPGRDSVTQTVSNGVEEVWFTCSSYTYSSYTMTVSYDSYVRGYREVVEYIDVNVPSDAVNAKLSLIAQDYDYDTAYTQLYAGSTYLGRPSPNDNDRADIFDVPAGTDKIKVVTSSSEDDTERAYLYAIKLSYYTPNYGLTIPVVEKSYDIDHNSRADKGIVEWQWRIVDENGALTESNFTNRAAGITWLDTTLRTGLKWHNSTILLRVKDMEGAWSDWASSYMSESLILDPEVSDPEMFSPKPVANFEVEYNPLKYKTHTQNIINMSYDVNGLGISYSWNIKKDGIELFDGVEENIVTKINELVLANGLGSYELNLTVINTASVASDKFTRTFEVIKGNTEPVLNLSKPVENSNYSSTINISGYVYDADVDDTVNIYYKIDTGSDNKFSTYTSTGANQNFSYDISTSSLSEGTHNIHVFAKDLYGDTSNIETRIIVIDKTAPTGSMQINNNATYTKSEIVTLSISATDNISGVDKMRLRNDSGSWGAWENYSATKANWSLINTNGTRTVRIQFMDTVGNISSEYIDTIILDKELPTGSITIKDSNDGDTVNTQYTDVILNITSSDTYSGVSQMRFRNDYGTWSSWETVSSSRNWTLTASNGTRAVSVQFIDNAGNISAEYTDKIIYDSTPPTGNIIVKDKLDSDTANTQYQDLTLNINAVDNVSIALQMRIRNESGSWSSWESLKNVRSWNLSNINGNKIVGIQFMDEAGNVSLEYSDNIDWDNIIPTGTMVINNNDDYTIPQTVTLNITYSDSFLGVEKMSFRNEVGVWSSWENIASTRAGWQLSSDRGLKTVGIRFMDKAGNISVEYTDTIIFDDVKPEINIIAPDIWVNDRADVIITTSDLGGSLLKTIRYIETNSPVPPANPYTWEEEAIDEITTPGINFVHVYAEDNAGNFMYVTKKVKVNTSVKLDMTNYLDMVDKDALAMRVNDLIIDGDKTFVIQKTTFTNKFRVNVIDTDISDNIDIRYRVTNGYGQTEKNIVKKDYNMSGLTTLASDTQVWYLDETTFETWEDGIYTLEFFVTDNKTIEPDSYPAIHDVDNLDSETDVDMSISTQRVKIVVQRSEPEIPTFKVTLGDIENTTEIDYNINNKYSMYPQLNNLYRKEYRVVENGMEDIFRAYDETNKVKNNKEITIIARLTDFAGNQSVNMVTVPGVDYTDIKDYYGGDVTEGTDETNKMINEYGDSEAVVEQKRATTNYYINIRKEGRKILNNKIFDFLQ